MDGWTDEQRGGETDIDGLSCTDRWTDKLTDVATSESIDCVFCVFSLCSWQMPSANALTSPEHVKPYSPWKCCSLTKNKEVIRQ